MRECCYFRTLPSCCFRSGPATCFYLQCLIPRVEMNFLIKPNPSQKQESLVREQQLLHSANIILYFIITFSMFPYPSVWVGVFVWAIHGNDETK